MSKDFLERNKKDIVKMAIFMNLELIIIGGLYFGKKRNTVKNIKYLYYNNGILINIYKQELYKFSKKYNSGNKLYISYKYNSDFIFSNSTYNDINKSTKKGYLGKIIPFNISEIDVFFNLYKNFFINKGLNYNEYSFFERLINIFGENLFILYLYKSDNIIGAVILLKFTDKIVIMFGGYKNEYIKKGLKYFTNKFIINYYKKNNEINEIIFGTGKVDNDLNDTLFLFKKKFGEINILKKI